MKSVSLRKPKREDLELDSVEVDSEREREERTLVCVVSLLFSQINIIKYLYCFSSQQSHK